MFTPLYTKRFEKDVKRMRKRNKNMVKLVDIMEKLATAKKFSVSHKDHYLIGNYVKH